jgi:hypothetical protein
MGSRHRIFPNAEEEKECKNNEISSGLGLGISRGKEARRGGCLNSKYREGHLGSGCRINLFVGLEQMGKWEV